MMQSYASVFHDIQRAVKKKLVGSQCMIGFRVGCVCIEAKFRVSSVYCKPGLRYAQFS